MFCPSPKLNHTPLRLGCIVLHTGPITGSMTASQDSRKALGGGSVGEGERRERWRERGKEGGREWDPGTLGKISASFHSDCMGWSCGLKSICLQSDCNLQVWKCTAKYALNDDSIKCIGLPEGLDYWSAGTVHHCTGLHSDKPASSWSSKLLYTKVIYILLIILICAVAGSKQTRFCFVCHKPSAALATIRNRRSYTMYGRCWKFSMSRNWTTPSFTIGHGKSASR